MATATLTSSAAVLLVKDVFAAANHYRDKLGFGYDGFFGETPSFCILQRDDCYLMLAQLDDPARVTPSSEQCDCNTSHLSYRALRTSRSGMISRAG